MTFYDEVARRRPDAVVPEFRPERYRQILESMSATELGLYRTECFRQLQHGQPLLGRLEASLVCATSPIR